MIGELFFVKLKNKIPHKSKNNFGDFMREKRLKTIFAFFMVCFAFLAVSCGAICLINGDAYTQSAISQRKGSISIKRNRGKIYDRNSIPLVDATASVIYLDEYGKISTKEGRPISPVQMRYGENSLAKHLVGYVDGDGNGVCGLEKEFDCLLKTNEYKKISVSKTADGRVMPNSIFETESGSASSGSVTLTIDSHIQHIAENALKKRNVSGAVVVLDTQNFDVLAMASAPDYNQNNVQNYLQSDGGELVNRCLLPYNAGSIFKCVTLAAGASAAKLRSQYVCTGALTVEGHTFSCNAATGHGFTGARDSFAKSCNCAFYTMGQDVGGEHLVATARAFGLGERVISDISCVKDSCGNIPDSSGTLDCINLSIGQGGILVTPLQAAKMVCIIANNGIAKEVNTIVKTTDKDGAQTIFSEKTAPRQVISPVSAAYVRDCMKEAVQNGTGKVLSQNPALIAGKTGTAETGWERDGRTLVHGWFCGYFPHDNPRYAMAVLIEDGGSGSQSAAPVFGEIAEEIIKIYPLG